MLLVVVSGIEVVGSVVIVVTKEVELVEVELGWHVTPVGQIDVVGTEVDDVVEDEVVVVDGLQLSPVGQIVVVLGSDVVDEVDVEVVDGLQVPRRLGRWL